MLKKLANCSFFEHEVDSNFNDILELYWNERVFTIGTFIANIFL